MPACAYCDEAFDDEDSYLAHLREAHHDELGPIDRRRAAQTASDGLPTGPLAVGVVVLVSAAVVAYVIFFASSGGGASADGPTNLWGVHDHGTIEMVVDGERVDFSRSEYQMRADAFHFEGGGGDRWHVHAEGVTLAWAMDSLGIGVTESTVTFEGTTYDDADPDTTVSITVDGEPVDPAEHVLGDGDAVRIVVEVG